MAYDPTFPPDHVALTAAPWRNQFNALKALIDAQAAQIAALQATVASQAGQITALQTALAAKPSMDDVNAAINTNSARNSDSVYYLQLSPSDPASQSDAQAIVARLNELISALNHNL